MPEYLRKGRADAMWGIIGAIVGFLGGLVVAHVTALLQRKNWQTQEAMKAYTELLRVGGEAFRSLNGLLMRFGNLDAQVGQRPLAEATKSDPEIQKEHVKLVRDYVGFGQEEDRACRNQMSMCWMLERDPSIRARIEQLEKQYDQCKERLHLLRSKLADRRKDSLECQIQSHPVPDSLWPLMEGLRACVASKYFHGEKAHENGQEAGVRPEGPR